MTAGEYLKKFAQYLARLLDIRTPRLKFERERTEGSSLLGGLSTDSGEIIIVTQLDTEDDFNIDTPDALDTLFRIAHEMRHAWQSIRRPDLLEQYQTREKLSLDDYNNQLAEIDAHAFASLIMQSNYHVKPLFVGLNGDTRLRIDARVDEIYTELRRL